MRNDEVRQYRHRKDPNGHAVPPLCTDTPAKDPRAIAAGSVTPWEPGGISPYQYEAGRQAARAAGREFDAYGAAPSPSPAPRDEAAM